VHSSLSRATFGTGAQRAGECRWWSCWRAMPARAPKIHEQAKGSFS